jgi:hypothetical protein
MSQEKTPHRHAAVIKQWADGATIQVRQPREEWQDMHIDSAPSWLLHLEYRVKPEVVRYKRYLWKWAAEAEGHAVLTVDPASQVKFPREQTRGFVRWIDTEWQEGEL